MVNKPFPKVGPFNTDLTVQYNYIDLYVKFTALTLQWNLTVQELKLMSMHPKRIDKQPHSDESQRR